jgi:hypothetical protein
MQITPARITPMGGETNSKHSAEMLLNGGSANCACPSGPINAPFRRCLNLTNKPFDMWKSKSSLEAEEVSLYDNEYLITLGAIKCLKGKVQRITQKNMLTERDLQRKSVQYRKALLRLIKACGAGHIGGDLSCLDILNVLYNRILRVSPKRLRAPTATTTSRAKVIAPRRSLWCWPTGVSFPKRTWKP